MKIYDLAKKRFIAINDTNIVSKNKVGDLTLVLDFENADIGDILVLSNFVDMISNTGYGAGLSRIPCAYYTNDRKVKAYFSDANLVAYDLDTLRIYFDFKIKIVKKIDKIPYFITITGDSCNLIIFKK
jgi:hypothetical protein